MSSENKLSIITLNIWALPGPLSSDKSKRLEAIGRALCKIKYDIVCLQEVWTKYDYKKIKGLISNCYPYHHYFYSGLIGSGLCTFSKWPIEECFYYRFPLNGYSHMIHHGDWLGGKGVGITQINVQGLIVNVYNTHLHAQYSLTDSTDGYFAHRVVQAFDTALFIKLTSQSADVSILAGDLNAEPTNLCTKIISCIANLADVYEVANKKEVDPETNDCYRNSYRDKKLETSFPGKRIDYIFFKTRDGVKVNPLSYVFPLEPRVPGMNFSFSDHEAVGACLSINKLSDFQIVNTNELELCQKECLKAAFEVCDKEVMRINKNLRIQTRFVGFIVAIFPILFNFDCKAIICTAATLSVCFGLLLIAAEYQNYAWIKNAKKRIKLMDNQFKKLF